MKDGKQKDFQQRIVFFAATRLTGTHLFLLFPRNDKDRLQQVRPSLLCYSIYWTSPTSTTSEMRTVMRGVASPTADDATVSASNHRFCVSMAAFLRSTTFYRQHFRSAITGPASDPIAPQGSNSELCRTASAAATEVFNMLIPVSEKEFLCVKRGWRTNSRTHATAPFTFSWLKGTPLRDTVRTGCHSDGPLTTNAVNWKTWKQQTCTIMRRPRWFWNIMILTLWKFRRERKPGWLKTQRRCRLAYQICCH